MKARKPHLPTESAQTCAASFGEQKKHRSAQFLVESRALRGVYGKMFCGSASVPMLSRAAALRHQALCSTDEQLPRNAHRAAAL